MVFEKNSEPEYRGKPSVVVQYQKSRDTIYENQFDSTKKRGGEGIIGLALNDITSIGQFLINLKMLC